MGRISIILKLGFINLKEKVEVIYHGCLLAEEFLWLLLLFSITYCCLLSSLLERIFYCLSVVSMTLSSSYMAEVGTGLFF